MQHGKRLKAHLKSRGLSQKEILDMATFSKGKLYGLFKLSHITEEDRKTLINDFGLESDFFEYEGQIDDKNFQKMYYDLLEKYNDVVLELAECRKQQLELISKTHTFSENQPAEKYSSQLKKTKS